MSCFNAYMRLAGAIDAEVILDEPLARHTTYRIGGAADLFIVPNSYSSLLKVIEVLEDESVGWIVMGKGSNILVSDEGYRGCVIYLGSQFSRMDINIDSCVICAGAGCLLSKIVRATITSGLTGLEMCAGIPGTLGGAIVQNAGSASEWISQAINDVIILDSNKELKRLHKDEIEWAYRSTSLPSGCIILEATLSLAPSTRQIVGTNMDTRLAKRRVSQPLGQPSCGSVFKNPEGLSVAKLLEDCGCKGYRVGGACVSDLHANFVINDQGASAKDVLEVIEYMHTKVKETYGIELSPEVKFLGFTQKHVC